MAQISPDLSGIVDGAVADAADFTTPINTIINEINGNLDNSNIKSGANIAWSKLASSAWTSWSVTWTGLTIGNGTSVAYYQKIGKWVAYRGTLTWGSSTSSSAVIHPDLPITGTSVACYGSGITVDSSPGNIYVITVLQDTSTRLSFYNNGTTQAVAGNYSTPFTLASGDSISWSILYEAA